MTAPGIIAILDMEWTAWEGSQESGWAGPGEKREIIQIGAIRLRNDEELSEIDSLDVLVKPGINPELSDYIIDVTGITQARLDAAGMSFADAMKRLVAFLGDDTKTVYSWGTDFKVIMENCRLNDIPFPLDEGLFNNAKELLSRTVDSALNGVYSSGLPEAMGFPPPGNSHQAVDDCRCIAEALRIIRRKGLF